MERTSHLKWYEWIGWLVNITTTVMAGIFVIVSVIGDELRAAVTGLAIAAIVVAGWTWVLLFYGRANE